MYIHTHTACMCVRTHVGCVCTRVVCILSHILLIETPWTIARQAPLSMGFPRWEYSSELPLPAPGDLPNWRIEPKSLDPLALVGAFFATCTTWEAHIHTCIHIYVCVCVCMCVCISFQSFPLLVIRNTEYISLCHMVRPCCFVYFIYVSMLSHFNRVWRFVTSWTVYIVVCIC